jgi:DnaJ-class molecular chaperone
VCPSLRLPLGMKITQERKVFEVVVTPGMRDKEKIVFEGDGDQQPDCEPGDIVIVLRQRKAALRACFSPQPA